MRHTVRNSIILLGCLLLAIWAIYPPETKLRKGKDLAGGASLIYGVNVRPTDDPGTVNKVIEVVKERLDPKGVMDMQIVAQGTDRIEITMPLPNEEVKALRKAYEDELKKLAVGAMSSGELDRILALPAADRTAEFTRLSGGDAGRMSRFEAAARAYDDYTPAKAKFVAAERDLVTIRNQVAAEEAKGVQGDVLLEQLRASLTAAEKRRTAEAAAVAPLEAGLDAARAAALAAGINPGELGRALQLSTTRLRLQGKDGKPRELDSPRERALKQIYDTHPDQKAAIDAVLAKYETYAAKRKALEDPQDIVRILKGAGVLSFRITVDPGSLAQEAEARQQLRTGGPRSVRVSDVRWFKVNKIENWVNKEEQLEELKNSASAFFMRMNYIAEEYKGEYYILCYDTRGMRLTVDDGAWAVASAYQGVDQLGRPAIDFRMDPLGADRLGALTENNVGKRMAVLLDDEVYTAPTLQSRISAQGQITGNFSAVEREYIIRVLSAGSLKAKLSDEPISINVLAPQLGADNLERGAEAGIAAFVIVGLFMIGYYFTCGFISMLALVFNTLILIGAMSLNHAAFTLPGIAGIILTFGQAVDANVLVYERMREEFNRGHDMRTAVRLGYQRAMSAIIDGNVTTMIICVVLGFLGTQEIKGFALTLGIGTASTLFAQLFATRVLFTLLVDKLGWRKTSFLPMVNNNWLGNRLIPKIDWMSIRFVSYTITAVLLVMGLVFLFTQRENLLGTEFRGGTSVTLQFKQQGPDGKPVLMKRSEVEDLVKKIADGRPASDPLRDFSVAEVIAVNPEADNVTSNQFTVKTIIKNADLVQGPIVEAFADKLDTRLALSFKGADRAVNKGAPLIPVVSPVLGASIDRPEVTTAVGEFYGGLAIVLEDIKPAVSKREILSRLTAARAKPDMSDTAARVTDVAVLAGSDNAVTSAVVLVRDADISYFEEEARWRSDLAAREWTLVTSALTQSQTLASVQSFSAAVATTFQNTAIVSVILSTILVIIYIWVRFNSFRFSLAAILTTLHDCVVCIGFVALATWLFNNANGVASTLGILPFKIDLNVMTAILTTLGFSLNDTIIVMDRIRENRGKLPVVTRKIINDSINQTVSRTLITSGTTFIAVITLYLYGGEGIRVFAYTMLVGVIVGTYSSIAVAAPLLWDKTAEEHGGRKNPVEDGATNLAPAA